MVSGSDTWATVQELRRVAPLIHNITNYVAMDLSANVLLAIGASPAMVHSENEVEEFVGVADALVINIGTLSPAWVAAMTRAAETARSLEKPWVLDPVGAGATRYRTSVARELSGLRPAVIRGNASEILALAGSGAAATRGVDSVHGAGDALGVARDLAQGLGCVIAVTGATDYVTDGERVLAVDNGHPLMTRVTALGCAATALIGAFLAVEEDSVLAAAQALAILGLCGEMAARDGSGPGTLRTRIVDTLYALDGTVLEGVRIS